MDQRSPGLISEVVKDTANTVRDATAPVPPHAPQPPVWWKSLFERMALGVPLCVVLAETAAHTIADKDYVSFLNAMIVAAVVLAIVFHNFRNRQKLAELRASVADGLARHNAELARERALRDEDAVLHQATIAGLRAELEVRNKELAASDDTIKEVSRLFRNLAASISEYRNDMQLHFSHDGALSEPALPGHAAE